MNKPIERIRIAGAALALSAGVLVAAPAQASGPVFGAVIGGGAGAVIGQSIGGRDGAIIGGMLGAAAGAAAASDHAYRRHDGYGGYGNYGGYNGYGGYGGERWSIPRRSTVLRHGSSTRLGRTWCIVPCTSRRRRSTTIVRGIDAGSIVTITPTAAPSTATELR